MVPYIANMIRIVNEHKIALEWIEEDRRGGGGTSEAGVLDVED